MTDAALQKSASLAAFAPPSVRQVAAVVAGNALEFYDFLTYSFFAVQIGRAFFPSDNPTSSLLASLATFGAGFLTRPVGAFVIGRFGDRVGRKPAMLVSFGLMGVSIIGLALTPPFRSIGIAAPVLAIVFRLVQGFALGGEVGPSTAYLIEAAPAKRRGFYVSLQSASQAMAILCAGLIGVGLSSIMDADALRDWGWRIAFLAGAVIVPFGLMLRRGLSETLNEAEPESRSADDRAQAAAGGRFRVSILALALLASLTTATYVLTYLTTYATATLHMASTLAFGATAVFGFTSVCFAPIGGWLSDRLGRKPVMICATSALLLLVLPSFYVMSHLRNAVVLLGAAALMSCVHAISGAAAISAITESLPKRVRSGRLGLLYALAIAIFGGSAQFNVAWLTGATHSVLAPAWYMMAGLAVGLIAMLAVRETAPVKLPAI